MIFSLLLALAAYAFFPSELSDPRPTFLKAREEALQAKKPLLVFVSAFECGQCDAAWNGFTADVAAASRYVSARIETSDFDGKVIAEIYGAGNPPAWIILDDQGKVKEKWNGGWKDAAGNPVVYKEPAGKPESKTKSGPGQNKTPADTKPGNPETVSLSKPSVQENTDSNTAKAESNPVPVKESRPATIVNNHPVSEITGYVLQAGYFGSEPNAQKWASDLQAKGAGIFTLKSVQQNGATFYRVISVAYTTEAEAQKQVAQLASLGVKATVKKRSEL